MATKSTKNHSLKLVKFLLVILSVAAFIGTYYYGQLLFSFYMNNWNEQGIWNLSVSETVLSNGTSEYARKIRQETGNARKIASEYKSDEYVESGEGWLLKEAALRDTYEGNLQAQLLEEAKNWVESQYYYDEDKKLYTYPDFYNQALIIDFSSDDQINADERYITLGEYNVFGLTKKTNGYYYKGFPLKYAEVDEDSIKSENELAMKQDIATQKARYKSTFLELKEELSNLNNYKYFLVNRYTGLYYTNMDGVKTVTEAKNEYQTDTEYFASIISGDFETSELLDKTLSGNNGSTWYRDGDNNIYFVSDDSGKFEYCFGKLDPDQYDMVIYVDTTDVDDNPEDVFTEIYKDWQYQAQNLNQNRIIFICSLLVLLLSLVLLSIFSGERNEDNTVKLQKIDKVPNSIHFLISWSFIISFAVVPMFIYMEGVTNWVLKPNMGVVLFSAPSILFFDEWLTSTSRQSKNKMFWKNTLIYMLIIKNWGTFKKWVNSGIDGMTHEDIKKNVFLAFAAYVVVMAICSAIPFFGIPIDIIISVFAFLYVRKLATGLDAISSALTKAEKGDYDFSVDVDAMPVALQAMGESVNDLTSGLNIALEDALKSERMKTELITNVSHDLKTPLTSIITYTDLLKQCDIEDSTANEYINVLEEKSQRLKKLVEDLVEAAKASSGNVTLNIVTINLNELTDQIYGEYEDILSEEGLELKLNLPEEPLYVNVDGQKTYRIIENLFSNVKKYAMPKTRVYLDLIEKDGFAYLSMKNVSRDEMNFDVDRLTERFVQGDDSRNTEGSGLGLSIAKSLTEIQGGRFEIEVDGDLFKVTIALPIKS